MYNVLIEKQDDYVQLFLLLILGFSAKDDFFTNCSIINYGLPNL